MVGNDLGGSPGPVSGEEKEMAISDEIREKERRIQEFLRTKDLRALLLKRQANFSWLTGGGLNLLGIDD
jgi:hypothetical protein